MASRRGRGLPVARKPSDVLAALPRPQGRDAIWSAIRKCRKFTAFELEHECRCNLGTIKTYLTGLTAAGFLAREFRARRDGKGKYARSEWKLVRDVGVEAPRVTRIGAEVTQGRARQQMWVAMRTTKVFTHPELSLTASTELCVVNVEDCKVYVQTLARAGYLVVSERGRSRHPAVYRFIKNTGPKAPQIQRIKQVFDPNLRRVMWRSGGEA